jgi:hypothetical protein
MDKINTNVLYTTFFLLKSLISFVFGLRWTNISGCMEAIDRNQQPLPHAHTRTLTRTQKRERKIEREL